MKVCKEERRRNIIIMMRDDALFNLRWDAQRTALLGSVASLYRDESFVDVTIVTNGQMFKAHKLLLSASSPYLKSILEVGCTSCHYYCKRERETLEECG